MNIRYSKALSVPRQVIKRAFSAIYPIIIRIFPLPKVLSIEETLRVLNEKKHSIARFGDSEFLYIIDKLNLPYQRYNEELATKLKAILNSNEPNIMVGLPIGYHSIDNLSKRSTRFWRAQISWIYPRLRKHLDLKKTYANASMTRLYIGFEDKSESGKWFEMVRKLWDQRDILLIEGEKSRLGSGNSLFENATSVKRILGPAHNSFERYEQILEEAKEYSTSHIVLVAMGPTAKPIAFELGLLGYQAVDIGNLDIEYEWYLRGATSKILIPGKYTSEAAGGRVVEDSNDEDYKSQIVASFL